MNIVNEFNKDGFSRKWKRMFPNYNIHPVTVQGHGDGAYCPVCPGLIISLAGVDIYKDTFPD